MHLSSRDRGIVERVKSARKAAGLKKWAVAAALRISVKEYSAYESSQALPFEHLPLFAALARVSPSYIITGRVSGDLSSAALNGILAPHNRCGGPCPHSTYWCNPNCDIPETIND